MEKEIELLPCPYCGNTEIQRYNYELNQWRVTCRDCRNTTKDWPTVDEAIEHWNTRTAREARLVEALEMAVLTIDRLADQQAMPDDGYLVNVEKISTILAEYRGEKANTEEKHDNG